MNTLFVQYYYWYIISHLWPLIPNTISWHNKILGNISSVFFSSLEVAWSKHCKNKVIIIRAETTINTKTHQKGFVITTKKWESTNHSIPPHLDYYFYSAFFRRYKNCIDSDTGSTKKLPSRTSSFKNSADYNNQQWAPQTANHQQYSQQLFLILNQQ